MFNACVRRLKRTHSPERGSVRDDLSLPLSPDPHSQVTSTAHGALNEHGAVFIVLVAEKAFPTKRENEEMRRVAVGVVVAAACLLAMVARWHHSGAVSLRGSPLSLAAAPRPAIGQLRMQILSDRPGSHVPQQILRNINGLWNKSISGRRTKNRKTGGYNLPKIVKTGRGHQWGEDPYMVTQMGLDAGNPLIMPDAGRMMRRMTVRRQWHWDKGGSLTGQPGFKQLGLVPPKVPIIGNAGMKMPIK